MPKVAEILKACWLQKSGNRSLRKQKEIKEKETKGKKHIKRKQRKKENRTNKNKKKQQKILMNNITL